MSYSIYSFGGKAAAPAAVEPAMVAVEPDDIKSFEEGAMMVEEGLECMRMIAKDMKAQFGERRGDYGRRGGYGERYGMRGGYGNRYGERDIWDDEDMMMRERRRRDSMGRYR